MRSDYFSLRATQNSKQKRFVYSLIITETTTTVTTDRRTVADRGTAAAVVTGTPTSDLDLLNRSKCEENKHSKQRRFFVFTQATQNSILDADG